jgi:hypothetical protein
VYKVNNMSISVFVQIGVTAGVPLEFNTIKTIQKLFVSKRSDNIFIYGITTKPINHDEQAECFDTGILDILSELTSEKEFKEKLANIAELRMDDNITCLRRKKEYVGPDDYANYKRLHIMDDDDTSEYHTFDVGELWFEFFDHCTSLNADFDADSKSSYDTVGSAHNFMERLNKSVDYFKNLGINEQDIDITHYNVLNI